MTMTPFLFVARIWKVLYHECIGKTILPQGMYARKRNSGLRRQRKAEGGRGYQLFPHPRHIPPGLAKNSDCGRAGRAGGHNPPPFGLGAEPANTGTSPLPVGCSHIHPKTACREVSERQWRSAAPVSAPASAGAWRSPLEAAPGAAGETKSFCPATKPAKTLGFRRFPFCMCCTVMTSSSILVNRTRPFLPYSKEFGRKS